MIRLAPQHKALGAGLLLLLATSASLLHAYRSRSGPPLELRAVERRSVRQIVTVVGYVEPLTTVEVRSKANGIVRRLAVDVGDVVHRGDVLAELDKDYPSTFHREAQAQAAMAEANRRTIEAQIRQALLDADTQQVELIKGTCQRQLELFEEGLVSRQDLEDCQRQLVIAQTQLNVKRAENDVLYVKLDQAEAQVRASHAALDRANEDLRSTVISSPLDGVVLTRDVEKGSAVSSILNQGVLATRLFTIADTQTVFVNGQVDEVDVGKLRVGMASRIRAEALPDRAFHGVVTRVAPMADKLENVTTFRVRVSIDNPGTELRSKMSVTAEIIVDEAKDALAVPETCLLYGPDGVTRVKLYDRRAPEQQRLQVVQVGITDGSFRQVTAGLAEGDKVLLR